MDNNSNNLTTAFVISTEEMKDYSININKVEKHFRDHPNCLSVVHERYKTGIRVIIRWDDYISRTDVMEEVREVPLIFYVPPKKSFWVNWFGR